ncbi:hypothetical protein [Shimia haliotis]|uniref:Uncharacterized protein n=1 Tax=Shimia haliotis TaxID=1280847 RepID=A0A1I4DDI8_9RHOB|nr:hypothetical protein [Shimia haliotis]SFK89991.1 hypothetical protein SAMN04488036_1039 [Shimia haliotis]
MSKDDICNLAKPQELVFAMERDLGLDRFSNDEKKVIYALTKMREQELFEVPSSNIMHHDLCATISKPTFYHCLKRLVDDGAIVRSGSVRSGLYRLSL